MLPCAAYVDGPYGIDGYYFGVPVVIGEGGIERIIEVKLQADEQKLLDTSLGAVKESVAKTGL